MKDILEFDQFIFEEWQLDKVAKYRVNDKILNLLIGSTHDLVAKILFLIQAHNNKLMQKQIREVLKLDRKVVNEAIRKLIKAKIITIEKNIQLKHRTMKLLYDF